MPTCKNNAKRYYSGKEPSPKGFGYCAHASKLGTRKRGKDGKMWHVKKAGKSKRWVRVSTTRPQPKKAATSKKKKTKTTKSKKKRIPWPPR